MKKNIFILLTIFIVLLWYFLYKLNTTNINLKIKINLLESELSWFDQKIEKLNNKQINTWSVTLEEENKKLKKLIEKYKDALVLEKTKNKSTININNSTETNITTTKINTNTATIATKNKLNYLQNPRVCNRLNWWEAIYWTPNNEYFKAVKLINSQLQKVWDSWQIVVNEYINKANINLANLSLSNSDKCMYSWLVDELQNQKWYLKAHKTQNWITTIGIDFVTYIDDISQIDNWTIYWPLFQTKNTSTKTREYTLTTNLQLQTLSIDSHGFTINHEQKRYINNFDNRLDEFCNGQKIYTSSAWTSMNRNENNWYCVKNRITKLWEELRQPINFNFNWSGELQKIDLDWRYFSLAW